jgi:WD40 repeat protein
MENRCKVCAGFSLCSDEFVAHGENVNCLALGRKSGQVMVTGGDDKKVNLWAVGRPNCIMVMCFLTSFVEWCGECLFFFHQSSMY